MRMKRRVTILNYLLLAIFLFSAVSVSAEEYKALEGVKSTKAIFDFRIGDAKSAALHMDLIYQTYRDLAAMKKGPDFVVEFIGPSVKLISKNRAGFSPEDQKTLDEIAKTITAMSKDGIKFEICLAAAKVFNVDPASVLPEIKRVGNGWISEIGYQAQGYSLVPAF
ncbi:MAG: DsrE family protein [Nitrospirota bacterium]|jgi:intracellular sulfur oxidation DsrE/DsrF family protein